MGIFGNKPEDKPGFNPTPSASQPSANLPRVTLPVPPPAPSPAPAPYIPTAAAAPQQPRKSAGPCVIASGISISGEITGDEDVVIEGRVEGNIRVGRDLRSRRRASSRPRSKHSRSRLPAN